MQEVVFQGKKQPLAQKQGTQKLKSDSQSATNLFRGQNATCNMHISHLEPEIDFVKCG